MLAKDFNLRHTAESGQPLAFYGIIGSKGNANTISYPASHGWIEFEHSRKTGRISYSFSGKYDKRSAAEEIFSRFGLGHDLSDIYGKIGTDRFMRSAIRQFYGMRITKSDPWEACLCFVVSQFNNIKRIRRIILSLSERFGSTDEIGRTMFPSSERISDAKLQEIRSCGTGFRDRYIKHVAEQFAHSFEPERLYHMKYLDAKDSLMGLDGIGDKVADCILLFGYNKFEAFPIDVWIKRTMERIYFKGKKRSIKQIHALSTELWGNYRGYAQQYLFEAARRNEIR